MRFPWRSACRKSKADSGLIIGTYSGIYSTTHPQIICTIADRTDIQHVVTVRNLLTIPVDLTCHGSISGSAPKVRFVSSGQNDTSTDWYADKSGVDRNHTWSHVTFARTSNGSGDEEVRVEVRGVWPGMYKQASVPVTITVIA